MAVLISKGSHHYFHWVFDALPRLNLLWRSGIEIDQYLIDQRASFHREYLDLLGIPQEKITTVKKNTHLQAEELIVPSFPGTTGCVTQQSCLFLQKKILAPLSENFSKNDSRRIYISRAKAEKRRVLNEKEVMERLRLYGFQCIVLEDLSVMEQVTCFASAEIIVAPHGAGLANLVYCKKGTKVIEFFSPNYVNPCYCGLSGTMGLTYAYLIGEGQRPLESKDPHKVGDPIKINCKRLLDSLELLGIK